VNSLISEASRTSKRLNVSDLIRKNKQEEKREKIVNIYTYFLVLVMVALFGTYIIL